MLPENYLAPIVIAVNALEGQAAHKAEEYLRRKEEVKTPQYRNDHQRRTDKPVVQV